MVFNDPQRDFCFRNAAYFTAVRGLRPTTRTREEFKTFEEACDYSRSFGDKRTMIYAVTKEGRDSHIVNA